MIDLHTHSIYSDGTETPATLVRMASDLGLSALALTDHDTLDGLEPFLALQPHVSTRLIAGIELSCRFLNAELHILGLFIEPSDPDLQERVVALRARRHERNEAMMARLKHLGIQLEWSEVASSATTDLVSRAHIARALVQKGVVSHLQEAFQRFLGEGAPAFVPFKELTPREAARWIREAGGVPVVAHPGRTAHRHFPWDDAMFELKRQGLGGLEAYYSDYGPTEERYFRGLAERLGMAQSGGSDFHGTVKPGVQLGRGKGGLAVPDEILEGLELQRGLGPERRGI